MTSNLWFGLGTPITWAPSGGTGACTLTSLANGAGRNGVRLDLGAMILPTARASWFRWYMSTKLLTGATLGNTIDLYFAGWSDDTTPAQPDGAHSGTDVAMGTVAAGLDPRMNLKLAGSVVVDNTTAGSTLTKSGIIFLPYRYVAPTVYNGSAVALSATGTDHVIGLVPFNPQAQ